MSIEMDELAVVQEDSPIQEDSPKVENGPKSGKSSSAQTSVQNSSQVTEGAVKIEEDEHQEPWRRLLQPPDYILMQNDLPSSSFGLVRGRQRFGPTKYSHPNLYKNYDRLSDSSSCHYHWCYRAPIGSTGSNLSDDVFSISPLGGSVKMVQFDDLYVDSDSENMTTKKKRRKSSSKSEDKLGSSDRINKEKARNRINSNSSETRSRKYSNSSEHRGRRHSSGSERRTRLYSSGSECDRKPGSGDDVENTSESPSASEKFFHVEAKEKRTVSVSSETSNKQYDTARDDNQNSLKREEKYFQSKRLKLTSKKDEIVLVDTMMGSDELKELQEREIKSLPVDGVMFLYAFVTLFCFPLGVTAIVLRVFSRRQRESGDFDKSAKYRKAAKWSALVGVCIGMAVGVVALTYFLIVPSVLAILRFLL